MTPAALADLLHAVAVDVLTERGLDTAVLPETVTVERPRNPEHGDYATNLALRSAKKAGVAPAELAGWLATALEDTDAIATAEVAGPGFLNLRLAADAQAGIVADVLAARRGLRPHRRAHRAGDQPRVRLRQPHGPHPPRAARAGPRSATRSAGCSRPRAPR